MNSRELLGAEIQYFRLDPRYWDVIIRRLKDSGLRCVTAYVPWETHLVGAPDASHPAGVLDFEGRTNPRLNLLRFLDLIEKHGLNLNFRCGPFCCNEMVHGGQPPWLVLGDPNMMVWDWQNRTTQGYWIGRQEGSQPSYLHPRYLAWCRKWIAAVDWIMVPHLKINGGCVTMVNLDNEISYITRDGFLDSDYNPVNVRPGGFYHQFLKQKYGSADNLPYGRKYASIRDVPPPRSVPETISTDLAWHTDWIEFKTWVLCEYIRRLRAMHESNGVRGVTFMTNFNPHLPEGVPTRLPDFEKATGGVTGYDFYRGVFMSYSGYHSMARVLKLMNASLNYTWSAEFMSGTWKKLLGDTRVSADHMRFMARCALAHGCKAIAWFMFHDRDCWGDAPVSSHGHARPSLEVLREIPELLFNKIRHWDALAPLADTVVVYDLIQHQHTAIGDPMPAADNNLHVGKPTIGGVEAGRASQEYIGLFRLIEEAGAQAGAVDIMHSARNLARYALMFLPGSPVIERKATALLGAYVRRGGILAISGPWPTCDEHGRPFTFLRRNLPASKADPCELRIGKGRVIWRRQYQVQEKAEKEPLSAINWVADLIKRFVSAIHVRIRPAEEVRWIDWQPEGGHREYRQPRNLGSAILQAGGGEKVLFVLNHYPEAARFDLEFGRQHPARRLVNLMTGETFAVKGRRAQVDIDRKSAEVYRLE